MRSQDSHNGIHQVFGGRFWSHSFAICLFITLQLVCLYLDLEFTDGAFLLTSSQKSPGFLC